MAKTTQSQNTPVRKPLTQRRLKELLRYNRRTGVFIRRVTVSGGPKAGDIAGSLATKGYLVMSIDGHMYRMHRLAWLYVHGRWPKDMIDHINLDKTDNRIANLREADNSKNKANGRLYRNNTLGFKGIRLHKQNGRFQAQIRTKGKTISLGYYGTKEEAHEAYCRAARKVFGEFARTS